MTQAARQTLTARWGNTLAALEAARVEYRALCAPETIDVRAVRKLAQRICHLEQLRRVLACELRVGG